MERPTSEDSLDFAGLGNDTRPWAYGNLEEET